MLINRSIQTFHRPASRFRLSSPSITHRLLTSGPGNSELVISPKDLQSLVQSDEQAVSIVDTTWFMPNSPRKSAEEFFKQRIPGSQFLDLDKVASSHPLGLKHMMPSAQTFAQACGSMGIRPDSHVVLYDTHGVFSSPRALFMFKAFGHQFVSVLNGGLPRWATEGYKIDANPPATIPSVSYPTPSVSSGVTRDYEFMVSNARLDAKGDPTSSIVLDARPKGRFLGTDAEPRPEIRSGHMPNSVSLPFNAFLETRDGKDGAKYTVIRPREEIQSVLEDALGADLVQDIIDGQRSVTTTCGSGMTAGVLWLGLKLLGAKHISLYDESWTGYADPSRKSNIVA